MKRTKVQNTTLVLLCWDPTAILWKRKNWEEDRFGKWSRLWVKKWCRGQKAPALLMHCVQACWHSQHFRSFLTESSHRLHLRWQSDPGEQLMMWMLKQGTHPGSTPDLMWNSGILSFCFLTTGWHTMMQRRSRVVWRSLWELANKLILAH